MTDLNSNARVAVRPLSGNRTKLFAGLLLLPVLLLALFQGHAQSQEQAYVIPAPTMDVAAPGGTAVATFAGGCFWGVQGVFQHVKGVKNAISGYAGGAKDTAMYETVGSGQTGHAETVQITYDPSVVTYGQLLQVYFSV
ncbi:peptide-methionine (S)-S-oxide reductase, partial [Devosia sp.]|uniref:peptide-methionine (S)-S-oxide reductase n=1 Tax=Devosia sp. TaxID=1871048 RepID=UPI00326521F8